MEQYQKDFIAFMLECDVLKFGDFTTKSGRKTPFFINTGFYRTGGQLKRLGEFYARKIASDFGTDFDVLFGPAYKGIPLGVSTVMALSEFYGKEIRYASNRKEIKDHGDKGILLGGPVSDGDRVVIIEDVTTAGTSIRETLPIIREQAEVEILGLVVSVDRQEKGSGSQSALREISETFGFAVSSIVSMKDVVKYLSETPVDGSLVIDDETGQAIERYYEKYGAK
ncbi:MAG: orotate phosphoribosyltransferase [Lachnospiraceae bacterium]|nr:orotate phosphoribosyltransferase [Lachnospiraceae bacterium]